MRLNSLAARLLVGAAVWGAVALLAGAFALSSLFRTYVERSFDNRLAVVLEGIAAFTRIEPNGEPVIGRLPDDPRFDQPYSGWYWQIGDSDETFYRSRSLWDQVVELPETPGRELATMAPVGGPIGQTLRAVTQAITFPGRTDPLRFVVAAESSETDQEVAALQTVLGWSTGALGAVLLIAMLTTVLYGLRPLRRLREGLADIRAGRADRLEGDYPAEIAPLAAELNALLQHNASIVERARTHVGNLAHSLKTPLAVLTNEAEKPGPVDAETVRRQTELMRRQVDHHLVRARAAGVAGVLGARSDLAAILHDLRRVLLQMHGSHRALEISVSCPPGAMFRGERQDLEEMLGNLLDNACKWASGRVAATVSVGGGTLEVAVDDDGPGLPREMREAVLSRGTRLDESVPGTGLGLSIVRDIAELYGGGIRLADTPLGGLRAVLILPAAEMRRG